MFKSPFSFEGRIRRSEFGVSFIIYMASYAILTGAVSSGAGGIGFFAIIFIPLVWFLWAQGAKRCHDLGKSGFYQLIPFYALWMLFKEGQPTTNNYGDNPKAMIINSYDSRETLSSSPIKDDRGNDYSYDGEHTNPGLPKSSINSKN